MRKVKSNLVFIITILGIVLNLLSCRNILENKIYADKLTFEGAGASIKIGENFSVNLVMNPTEARENETITYESSNSGILEIIGKSNDGVVIKGLSPGNTVISAKSKNVTAYYQVKVEGGDFTLTPYINVNTPVIELKIGQMKQQTISLYGGSALDNNGFEWELVKTDAEDSIRITPTLNTVVIHGERKGSQKIRVTHHKAEYDSEILVFVSEEHENPIFITSTKNVILMDHDGSFQHAEFQLYGGNASDIVDFKYQIIEGHDIIEMHTSHNIMNVRAINTGTAKVRVSHAKASPIDFDVRIIVVNNKLPLINVDKTFAILNEGETVIINATVENPTSGEWMNEFSHVTLTPYAEDIIDLSRANGQLFIIAKEAGVVRIAVSNKQATFAREILIYVRGEMPYRDDFYITTSQNIIQIEVGQEAELNMLLVGGNEGDADGFEWVIDDGRIINVISPHGNVKYIRERRAVNNVFMGKAYIEGLMPGVARITITNRNKAPDSSAVVLVKVYPRGTFTSGYVPISTDGLIKVLIGKREEVTMVAQPKERGSEVGLLNWELEGKNGSGVNLGNMALAQTNNLTNFIDGTHSGLAKLHVTGNNIRGAFEGLVLIGTQYELDNASIIYVDNMYQSIAVQQSVSIEVKNSKELKDDFLNNFQVSMSKADEKYLYAVMIKNRLMIQGKLPSEDYIKLEISNSGATNIIEMNVRVESPNFDPNKPFYLDGVEVVGVVRGIDKSINVTLFGAGAVESQQISWAMSAEDKERGIIDLIANGTSATIKGKVINESLILTVSHSKSQNVKKILVYVVATEADLSKLVVSAEKTSFLMREKEELFIKLLTNAVTLEDKQSLIWNVENDNVLWIDPGYGEAGIITASNEGTTFVTVSAPAAKMLNPSKPAKFSISVAKNIPGQKLIQIAPVIEVLIGENKTVHAENQNLTQQEKDAITWQLENTNEEIVVLNGKGESVNLLGRSKGVTSVNVIQDGLGFSQTPVIMCANTYEEMYSMYILAIAKTYYKIEKNEEINLQLTYGPAGFPEHEKNNIKWTFVTNEDNEGALKIISNKDKATIVGIEEGTHTIEVSHTISLNKVKLTIEVNPKNSSKINLEFRNYIKTKGMLWGAKEEIELKLYNGNQEITSGYSLLEVVNEEEIKKNEIISVNKISNILDITAKIMEKEEVNTQFITVRHQDANENARIMIYTAKTQTALDNFYPVMAEKKNYLIGIGEEIRVKLVTDETKDGCTKSHAHTGITSDACTTNAKIAKITWGGNYASVIQRVTNNSTDTYKDRTYRALKVGNAQIEIKYDNELVETVYVSVIDKSKVNLEKRISTESIIGIVKGTQVKTGINSNLTSEEIEGLIWESEDESLIEVIKGDNGSATIVSKIGSNGNVPNRNETYVTVRHETWLKRHILVYTVDSEKELGNGLSIEKYMAMNLENQYIRIGKDEEVTVPMYYSKNKPNGITKWKDKYGNGVFSFESKVNGESSFSKEAEGDKVKIRTFEEGIGVIEIENEGRTNYPNNFPTLLYVEVSNDFKGNGSKYDSVMKFLSTLKNVYTINPDDGIGTRIEVSAYNMTSDEIRDIKWKASNNCITVLPDSNDRQKADILANHEGEAIIEVYHGATNVVEIKVIVTRNPEAMGMPYIEFEDTVRVGKGVKRQIEAKVQGLLSVDQSKIKAQVVDGSGIVSVENTGSLITFDGKSSGQALVKIEYLDSSVTVFSKQVIVVVTTTPDGIIYFTTKENFNIVRRNEYKNIEVQMIGYEEKNLSNIVWEMDRQYENILELRGNGLLGQVKGLSSGTAKITVKHFYDTIKQPNAEDFCYSVDIIVRVSDEILKPVYLTTVNNIVAITKGLSRNVDIEFVNGNPAEFNQMTWQNMNPSVMEINPSGIICNVRGLVEGVGRIRVSHPSSSVGNFLDIVVIIEKDYAAEGIYITTSEIMVEVRPDDSQRRLNVNLIGGTANDKFGFNWEIMSHNSYEKFADGSNKVVLDMVPNADEAIIVGKNEGEAIIRVTHPKTNHRLEIKILVRLNTQIKFAENMMTMYMGDTISIPLTAPTGTKVIYETSEDHLEASERKVEVNGTNSICVITAFKQGIVQVHARNLQGSLVDTVLLNILFKDLSKIRHIETDTTIITLVKGEDINYPVTARANGEKDNGGQFNANNVNDNVNLEWNIYDTKTANKNDPVFEIIGLGGQSSFEDGLPVIIGDRVSLKALKAGNAELQIRHPLMKGYVKRIYVQVYVSDAVFKVSPQMLMIQPEGQPELIEAFIEGIKDPSYDKLDSDGNPNLTWKNYNPELITMMEAMDNKGVYVYASNVGITERVNAVVTASYKDGPEKRVNIFVDPPKRLTVINGNQVSLLPNTQATVYYEVVPNSADVKYTMDWNTSASVAFYKPDQCPDLPDGQGKLVINGLDYEGVTIITLESQGLKQQIIVNTHKNYVFNIDRVYYIDDISDTEKDMNGGNIIRGLPYVGRAGKLKGEAGYDTKYALGGPYYVKYNLNPAGYGVEFDLEGDIFNWIVIREKTSDPVTKVEHRLLGTVAEIDKVNQIIKITPGKAGYAEIRVICPFNEGQKTGGVLGHDGYIKMLFYYENIEFDFIISSNSKSGRNSYTRFDSNGSALFIADGSKVEIEAVIDNVKYQGNDFRITNKGTNFIKNGSTIPYNGVKMESADYSYINKFYKTPPANIYPDKYTDKSFRVQLNTAGNFVLDNSNKITKLGSSYIGLLSVEYEYYAGDTFGNKKVTKRTYMVWGEVYNWLNNGNFPPIQ